LSPSRKGTGNRRSNSALITFEMNDDEVEFCKALDAYKRKYDKPFPSNTEILHVQKSLGYEKPRRY
jgi:hypothetical protein